MRVKSILRKAAERSFEVGDPTPASNPAERALTLHLLQFPEAVDRAMELRAPNHLADYAFELAGAFNRFYDSCHILSEQDDARRAGWLGLSQWSLAALERSLQLLGIEVPDRM